MPELSLARLNDALDDPVEKGRFISYPFPVLAVRRETYAVSEAVELPSAVDCHLH